MVHAQRGQATNIQAIACVLAVAFVSVYQGRTLDLVTCLVSGSGVLLIVSPSQTVPLAQRLQKFILFGDEVPLCMSSPTWYLWFLRARRSRRLQLHAETSVRHVPAQDWPAPQHRFKGWPARQLTATARMNRLAPGGVDGS